MEMLSSFSEFTMSSNLVVIIRSCLYLFVDAVNCQFVSAELSYLQTTVG
jgi:hypothetical protein